MSEGDSLLQYPKRHDSNGGEGPSTMEPRNQPAVARENSMEDKHSECKRDREGGDTAGVETDRAMNPDNAEVLETQTPKPRERKVELITYKSVECGLEVTDIDLVAESSVNMISTNRDRKKKEIIFEMAGDGDRESMRLLSFCRTVRSFTVASESSEGPIQSAETNILHAKPELSSAELQTILDEWDVLINCVGERIASCGSKILSGSNKSPLSLNLLRILANITDVADQLERDAIMLERGLKYIANDEWRRKATELKESIKSDLVTKVNSLFGRASNIMSIDEAYRAREQNASLKRLSWITSLYGMNVDILKDNPRWTTYFYIAVPTFVLVILTVVILKYLPLESMKAAYQSFLDSTLDSMLSIRTRTQVWDEETPVDEIMTNEERYLLNASKGGSTEIINRVLFQHLKKSRKILGDYGGHYLCASAENGHEAVVQLLLEKGADKDKALSLAAEKGHEVAVRLLLEKGAHEDTADDYGGTPLIWAARNGHEAVVRLLLEKGADTEKADNHGGTPLSSAACHGHEAIVRLLLEKGAETDKADSIGGTPLTWAACYGHEAIVRLLLEKEADKDKADRWEDTPLNWAARAGHEAIVRILLDNGADKDKANVDGNTPLSRAAFYGHEAVVRLLLKTGADKDKANNQGDTPSSLASGNGHKAVARLLSTYDEQTWE